MHIIPHCLPCRYLSHVAKNLLIFARRNTASIYDGTFGAIYKDCCSLGLEQLQPVKLRKIKGIVCYVNLWKKLDEHF